MQTDYLFYRLFKTFPSSFFELIGRAPGEAKDYDFDSVEVKQTAFRFDGLFIPVGDDINKPLYFVEVQFRYNGNIYSNLFAEIFTYLDQNDPKQDWRGVVIYGSSSFEPKHLTPYRALLNSEQVTRIYLDELPESNFQSLNMKAVELIVVDELAAQEKGKGLLRKVKEEVADEAERIDLLDLIETILGYKFANISREELEKMFDFDDFKQTRLGRQMLEEGIEKGRQEGKLEVVSALVERGLSVAEISGILQLDEEKIRQAARKSEQN